MYVVSSSLGSRCVWTHSVWGLTSVVSLCMVSFGIAFCVVLISVSLCVLICVWSCSGCRYGFVCGFTWVVLLWVLLCMVSHVRGLALGVCECVCVCVWSCSVLKHVFLNR